MSAPSTTVPPDIVLAGHLVTPDGVRDGWVRVTGTAIAEIGSGPAPPSAVTGRWIVPGFVDVHCHGGGGGSFTSSDPAQLRAAIATHRAHGTTTLQASLVTAPLPELAEQVSALAEHVEDGQLAGLHLEGPFLSAARCGAHDPTMLRAPDREAVARLLEAGRGTVSMVTLAPELDGATEAVRQLVDQGVLAGVGRTVLITDAISATAAGDGQYELGPFTVTVRDGEPRLEGGSLAGSTLTMDAALRNLVLGCGVPMTTAVHAASTRPAELLGLADRVGTLRPGLDADLVVLDDDLRPRRVLHKGTWVR